MRDVDPYLINAPKSIYLVKKNILMFKYCG